MIHSYNGINIHYEPHLDGGGREVYPEFLRIVRENVGKARRAYEFCAGTAFIGFSLLADGMCETLALSDIEQQSVDCCRRTIEKNNLSGRVNVYQSNGLEQIPPQTWDLVLGNPPHFSERQTNLPQSPIINVDTNWEIHKGLFRNVGKYLSPNGSIFLVENGRGSGPETFEEMMKENGLRTEGVLKCNLNRPSKFYFMWIRRAK